MIERRITPFGLLATGVLVGSVALLAQNQAETRAGNEDPSQYGEPLPRADALMIETGANFRSTPRVNGIDNLLAKSTLQFLVAAPDGVLVEREPDDGEWFGVKVSDITSSASSQDIQPTDLPELEADADGIVWINSQKAAPWQLYPVPDSNGP